MEGRRNRKKRRKKGRKEKQKERKEREKEIWMAGKKKEEMSDRIKVRI